jgi:hypothetical protein
MKIEEYFQDNPSEERKNQYNGDLTDMNDISSDNIIIEE